MNPPTAVGLISNFHRCSDPAQFIRHIEILMPLFDSMNHVVFFIKNPQAQYILVNQTLLERSGFSSKQDLIGLTPGEIFSGQQGLEYTLQDLKVLAGKVIENKLELHNYRSGQLGWCMTHKIPIYDSAGNIAAMAGVSIDLAPDDSHQLRRHKKLAAAVDCIREHLDQKLSVALIAQHTGISVSRLERLFKSVLQITPLQMIQKMRLEAALNLLKDTQHPIVEIAVMCGYADHSAFSRQFKQLTGVSPLTFRKTHQERNKAV
ncbi:AraC family transcriptional regulator [Neisseria sp. ZJ106]|uniref:AraC family transcriptional regulator n=1 Tax=Neisseria lisongii TaxID=2912188 RepID=A0ABY7RJA8_9NEIS|nr:AraC family transcriptional regulator [Neisseria lisongii]MCF7521227.1 AraC family transcriptional regulator [Neisseria lisongii]WCL71719.1 AraC family transcriptional regulator [Neisseria lisongii]